MGILQFLNLKPKSQIKPIFDDTLFLQFISSLEQKKYDETIQIIKDIPSTTRLNLVFHARKRINLFKTTEDWLSKKNNSVEALFISGVAHTLKGWDIRGGAYISFTSSSKIKKFHKYLEKADEFLSKAIEVDPSYSDAYAQLIQTRYPRSQYSLDDLYAIFQQAITYGKADKLQCYLIYQLASTKKWQGSNNAMFHFTEKVTCSAPRGSSLHVLTACAYNELALSMLPSSNIRRSHEKRLMQKLRVPEITNQVTQSLYNWLDTTPELLKQAIDQKQENHREKYFILNHFSSALYWTGALYEAKIVFDAIHNSIHDGIPWCYFGITPKEFKNTAFTFDRFNYYLNKEIKK